jgi:hypothetical protein
VLVVHQWAELRRLHFTENVGVRELARRFGLHRKTVRRALQRADPPKYARPPAASKLDAFKDEVHRLLKDVDSTHASTCTRAIDLRPCSESLSMRGPPRERFARRHGLAPRSGRPPLAADSDGPAYRRARWPEAPTRSSVPAARLALREHWGRVKSMRRAITIVSCVLVSLALTANIALADACENASRPAPIGNQPTATGNWVWLPSLSLPFPVPAVWAFAVPGGPINDSGLYVTPGANGNFTNGAAFALLGMSANCDTSKESSRQSTNGIQNHCPEGHRLGRRTLLRLPASAV